MSLKKNVDQTQACHPQDLYSFEGNFSNSSKDLNLNYV